MKKYFYLLVIALCAGALFSSCSKNDDEKIYIVDDKWQADNEKVFNEIAANSEYTKLESLSGMGSVYYKVLKKGTSEEPIYYNSTVKVYYHGISMDESSRKMTYFFDSKDPQIDPSQKWAIFGVNVLVDGFTTALQHMHPGDRWEIWIPWQLGYGATGNRDLRGQSIRPWAYSTLRFELEVIEVLK